jgi:hypothetical protein
MNALTEYYKFHRDISRLFMNPISQMMNRYHDKKRRLEYNRIKKMLNLEETSQNNISQNNNS